MPLGYLDKYGRDYDACLATQREHLDALRLVVRPEVFEELEFYCDTVNQPAPAPDGSRTDKHSTGHHSCPYGCELTQWLLTLGQHRRLL